MDLQVPQDLLDLRELREKEVPPASQDPQELLVKMDRLAHKVTMDYLEREATVAQRAFLGALEALDPKEREEPLDSQVHKVKLAPGVMQVNRDPLAPMVEMEMTDPQALQDPQAQQDPQVTQGPQEASATEDKTEQLELKEDPVTKDQEVAQAHLARQESLEPQVSQDPMGPLAHKENEVKGVSEELLDHKAWLDLQDHRDPKVWLGTLADVERMELKETRAGLADQEARAIPDHRVTLVTQDSQDYQAHQDNLDQRDREAYQAGTESQDLLAVQAVMDPEDLQVMMDRRDPQVFQDPQDLLDLPAIVLVISPLHHTAGPARATTPTNMISQSRTPSQRMKSSMLPGRPSTESTSQPAAEPPLAEHARTSRGITLTSKMVNIGLTPTKAPLMMPFLCTVTLIMRRAASYPIPTILRPAAGPRTPEMASTLWRRSTMERNSSTRLMPIS